jgi:hypothetical protein
VLFLTFRDASSRRSTTIAAPSFRFAGDCIENGRGEFVARHVGRDWLLNEEWFHSLECEQPVQCLFEGQGDASETRGPLRKLQLTDGTLTGDGKPLAELSRHEGTWLSVQSSRRYSRIGIIAAGS